MPAITPITINPGATSSYKGASLALSQLTKANAGVENNIADSILNPNSTSDPNDNIFRKFQISALIGLFYDLLSWFIQIAEENKKALKATDNLALAAK